MLFLSPFAFPFFCHVQILQHVVPVLSLRVQQFTKSCQGRAAKEKHTQLMEIP